MKRAFHGSHLPLWEVVGGSVWAGRADLRAMRFARGDSYERSPPQQPPMHQRSGEHYGWRSANRLDSTKAVMPSLESTVLNELYERFRTFAQQSLTTSIGQVRPSDSGFPAPGGRFSAALMHITQLFDTARKVAQRSARRASFYDVAKFEGQARFIAQRMPIAFSGIERALRRPRDDLI